LAKTCTPATATNISLDDLREAPREKLLETIEMLLKENARLAKRVEQLDANAKKDSSNSSKPPSSNNPYQNKDSKQGTAEDKGKCKKPGGKLGHTGHRQALLKPTHTEPCKPEKCGCGCTDFQGTTPFYTHQVLELPEIKLNVTHFILHQGECLNCGKINKGRSPKASPPVRPILIREGALSPLSSP